MNRINPHRIIQQHHPTPARHIEDLGHVRKIARGAYHLGSHLACLELPHERGFCPSDPRRAMLGTQRMDIAEIIHPMAARGVKNRQVSAVVNVPRVGFLPGDAERGNDAGDSVGEVGGDVWVGDVADTPVRHQASETGGAVDTWGFRPAEVAD